MPLVFSKTQLPPIRSDTSKQVTSSPRSLSFLRAAMPEDPAPMTATVGAGSCRTSQGTENATEASP